ncbi:hypothetical protein HC723_11680 [Vibrio sp. S11_S32]|uniref:hypothetical protein n=1 Tax=Vibrio sp. S11_S32 TaxID=2720225 RepID=UPI00168043CA|nr:hypothetical protein [Vibrio sp. S11_S32]MBD1577092.1 hypothetical protein [Vibrio sp. S11_S32]
MKLSKSSKSKAKKDSKEKKGVPNSVAFGVIALGVAAAVYFTVLDEPSHFNGRVQQNSSSGVSERVVTTKVPAPKEAGSPVLIPPNFEDLKLYQSEMFVSRLNLQQEKQNAELEKVKLEKAKAIQERSELMSSGNSSDFGIHNSTLPVETSVSMPPHVKPTLGSSTKKTGSSVSKSVALLSIGEINGSLEAMLHINGSLVSVNRHGVSSSDSENLPTIRVDLLTSKQVCIRVSGKPSCLKVN